MTPARSGTASWSRGKVAWFDAPKGFGFIEPASDPRALVYVDYSSIEMVGYRTLVEGQPVAFIRSRERPEAVVVRVLAEGVRKGRVAA
ncbi:cold shock domain-containing protein [Nocardia lijiangensis]|uniref:cold shock domain-containing protein n=1 Tax=Nocardia lijiangensis TaxID=299618 RepID=UPI00082B0C4F|nr:cold shock domain-containing protein [Nocardia lijiangensis]